MKQKVGTQIRVTTTSDEQRQFDITDLFYIKSRRVFCSADFLILVILYLAGRFDRFVEIKSFVLFQWSLPKWERNYVIGLNFCTYAFRERLFGSNFFSSFFSIVYQRRQSRVLIVRNFRLAILLSSPLKNCHRLFCEGKNNDWQAFFL